MPVVGEFHVFYWRTKGGAGGGGAGQVAQYPAWQSNRGPSLLMVTPLGLIVIACRWCWMRACWWWRWLRLLWPLSPAERDQLLDRARRIGHIVERSSPVPPPPLPAPAPIPVPIVLPEPPPLAIQVEIPRPPPALSAACESVPRAFRDLTPDQKEVLTHVARSLRHPMFTVACRVVRHTATTLGFSEPGNPITLDLWRRLKSMPGEADNCWRHMYGCDRLRVEGQARNTTLTNPEANLLIELAYHDFALHPRPK